MFSTSSVMIAFAFIFFVIYFMIIDSSPGRKLFCFFNSMMLCMFCPIYTVTMMADTEAKNEIWNTSGVFTLKSGIANIFIMILIAAMFFRTLYIKLSMLIKQEHLTSIWDFIFLLPLFMTMLMWWMMPHHPNLMLVGRLRSVSLVVFWLMPLGILLLYHLL